MKESMWALGIFGLSLFVLLLINTFGSITVTNQFNYTAMKNTVEAAMYDSLDIPHYRTGFCLCSNVPKVDGKWVFENSSQYTIIDPVDNDCTSTSFSNCELLEGEYKIDKKVFAESLVRRFSEVVGNNREYQIVVQDVIEYPPKVSVAIKSKDSQPLGDGKFTISNQMDAIFETNGSVDLKYNVKYDYLTNGGTSSTKSIDNIAPYAAVDLTPVAYKDGWEFVGWNTDKNAHSGLTFLEMQRDAITLYAIFKKEAQEGKIRFVRNGNTAFTYNGVRYTSDESFTLCSISAVYNNETQNTWCSGTITLPILEAASGFITKGWDTRMAGTSSPTYSSGQASVTVETNGIINLYGQSEKGQITRTVTYNSNGGSGVSSNSCTIGTVYNGNSQGTSCDVTLNGAPGRNDYTFLGWQSSANGVTYNAYSNISISSDVTMTAQWQSNKKWHFVKFFNKDNNVDDVYCVEGCEAECSMSNGYWPSPNRPPSNIWTCTTSRFEYPTYENHKYNYDYCWCKY